jgi:hypothetical protein
MPAKRTVKEKRTDIKNKVARLQKQGKAADQERINKLNKLIEIADDDLDPMDIDTFLEDEVDADDASNGEGEGQENLASSGNTNTPSPAQASNPTPANVTANTTPGQTSTHAATAGRYDEGNTANTGTRNNSNNSKPIVKTEPDEDSLFVPSGRTATVPSNESVVDLDKDPEEPLLSVGGSGGGRGVETTAWSEKQGYINRYGKKGCMRYRLDDFPSDKFEKSKSVNFISNAMGTRTEPDSRTLWLKKARLSGQIWGVAWRSDGSRDDLRLIDPAVAGKANGGDNWPTTYVLVNWIHNEEMLKRWETRSTVRRFWKKSTDKLIYEAASAAEDLYLKASGNVRGYTRSPSLPLITRKSSTPTRQSPRLSFSPSPVSPLLGSDRKASRTPISMSPKPGSGDMIAKMEQLRMLFCMTMNVRNFSDLDKDAQIGFASTMVKLANEEVTSN